MDNKYDVFISYRRNGGDIMAKYLYLLLTEMGYSVFYDFESLSSGQYGNKIMQVIENCSDFIVILSPGIFTEELEEDWVLKEVQHAVDCGKNIVPVKLKGFNFARGAELEAQHELIRHLYTINTVIADDIGNFTFDNLKKFMVALPGNIAALYAGQLQAINRNRAVLEAIPADIRKDTVKNALYSLVKENNADMVYSMVKPYLDAQYNVRLNFDYRIELTSEFDFYGFADIPEDKYYKLKERLTYTKKFIADAPPTEFWIKLDTGLADLDSSLHNERVLFSEDFNLDEADLQKIINIPAPQRADFINKVLKLQLIINGQKQTPLDYIFTQSGLHLKYAVDTMQDNIMNFKLSFIMPFNKKRRFFFASISDPTYSPSVVFAFDSDCFNVNMIPFLSQNVLSKDSMAIDGECEFSIDGEWVLPMSGAVFVLTKEEEA